MSHAPITAQEFQRFQDLIYTTAGIHLSHNKQAMLAARISKRLRALRIEEYRDYLSAIETSDDELVQMLDCVTTNETRFFREQKQFDFLQQTLVPRWDEEADEGRRPRTLRVWSAGCSTGEEPYSVAMTLLGTLRDPSHWSLSIVATDLSTRALDIAARGIWPLERAGAIPQPWLRRFMLRGRGSQLGKIKAGEEIRSIVSFYRLNLNEETAPIGPPFDLILCRNVLIYFDVASRTAAVDRLIDRLLPGGFFFVGHAETLHGITARVRSIAPTMYRREP